ncbi:hypothetical protein FUAX_00950 [Fulvitalea axinellae]|uniref:DUF4870 domain-containing protein n=1 Tax=Fulvitalea axinellae TaxID=1182444 RepID=A0AAU9CD49_9BACT|nr:hypothetical protein FUAX_00950 [Fulvitalea axinellae]
METSVPSGDERTWAMFSHLSSLSVFAIPFGNIIIPMVIWLSKKKESAFVDEHGKASLNFQLSVIIYMMIIGVFALVLFGLGLVNLGLSGTEDMYWRTFPWEFHFEGDGFIPFFLAPGFGLIFLLGLFWLALVGIYIFLVVKASLDASSGRQPKYFLALPLIK